MQLARTDRRRRERRICRSGCDQLYHSEMQQSCLHSDADIGLIRVDVGRGWDREHLRRDSSHGSMLHLSGVADRWDVSDCDMDVDCQSRASYVFTTYNNQSGFESGVYVTLIGCLSAASIFTGYDTAAHVAEETTAAHNSVPLGMIYSVVNALVLGLILIIGMNFCIPPGGISTITYGDDDNPQSYATLWDMTVGREVAVVFLLITLVAIECSNCANLTSAARMIYSLARYELRSLVPNIVTCISAMMSSLSRNGFTRLTVTSDP